MHIPDKAARLMAALESAGHEAFVVGGAVRDALLGRPVDDIDIASDADAATATQVLAEAGARVIPTGIAHGTITAVLDDESFEVTTFRIDGSYSDSRHPDSVAPARSIEEDLARRDFTINAMAYNGKRGLVDPFGGRTDLEQRVIRCVGDPPVRFGEDALRMLRAIRFAAQLGFEIDRSTADAIHERAQSLGAVSIERINTELSKSICAPGGADVLGAFPEVVSAIIPETKTSEGSLAWKCGLAALRDIKTQDLTTRLAALFGGFPNCGQVLLDLRFPKRIASASASIAEAASRPLPGSAYELKRLLGEFGYETLRKSLVLLRARAAGDVERLTGIEDIEKQVDDLEASEACLTLGQLAVDGSDIENTWGLQGRDVGRELESLLDRVMRGELPNERETLLAQRPLPTGKTELS